MKTDMQSIVFEDEIILFWDRPDFFDCSCKYVIFLNGEKYRECEKTHCEIRALSPETSYSVLLEAHTLDKTLRLSEKVIKTPSRKKRIDVTQAPYYAKGDGKTLNTAALQKAFDDCTLSEAVYIPDGVFLTGSLRLHDNTELYISPNAVIQGTENTKDYLPKIKSRFEGIEMLCCSALINIGTLNRDGGYNCKNVTIRGGGTICGGAAALMQNVINTEKELLKKNAESLCDKENGCECPDTIPGRVRPRLINISSSQNVVLSNLKIKYGPSWTVHMIYSDSVITHGCLIESKGVWNGDGWNPDSSSNCVCFDTDFCTSDDMIAIKSGKNPEGDRIAVPARNIKIFDCRCIAGGGCTIGSEMSGGVSDVFIWDCDFKNSFTGLSVKTTPQRGGYIKNVYAKNCTVPRIIIRTKLSFNNDGEPSPDIPVMENFHYEDIYITGECFDAYKNEHQRCEAIHIEGFENKGHELKNISFKNIFIKPKENGEPNKAEFLNVKDMSLSNVTSVICGK